MRYCARTAVAPGWVQPSSNCPNELRNALSFHSSSLCCELEHDRYAARMHSWQEIATGRSGTELCAEVTDTGDRKIRSNRPSSYTDRLGAVCQMQSDNASERIPA